jgi:hypothetical protein
VKSIRIKLPTSIMDSEFEMGDICKITKLISQVLKDSTIAAASAPKKCSPIAKPGSKKKLLIPDSPFDCLYGDMPTISIEDYLERLTYYFNCQPATLVLIIFYIKKCLDKKKNVKLNDFNVHR